MKLIKTVRDHRAALKRLKELMQLPLAKGSPQADELELLAFLIETYERAKFPIRQPTSLEAILFRMEQEGLTREDLASYLGGKSRVSEVLNGKRPLSLTMARKLHTGLGIPADILLQESIGAGKAPQPVTL